MARKSKRPEGEKVELSMTPMIDVVFQLLIFFVVTLKQDDIFSKLTAARPAPNTNQAETVNQDEPISVVVCPGGPLFNNRPVSINGLDANIKRLSSYSKKAMVVIKCTKDSKHGMLVDVLDICYKHGMTSLSIFSM